MKKIVIAGGSGYLGRLAARYFLQRGWRVVTLARKKFLVFSDRESVALWDGKSFGPWESSLENADLLLNLAGRTVNCRYSRKNRAEILNSRLDSTWALGEAVRRLPAELRPKLWLNSSTATIYRHALDRSQDELSGEIGKGFSVEIAKAWEQAFFAFQDTGIRMAALRTAMVFGPGVGGVYEAYKGIVKKGLGGSAGSGDQFVSWVHAEDFLGMIDFLEKSKMDGVVNLCSPHPLPNCEFMRLLRQSLGIKIGLPAPEWLLEIGAVFMRTETELLLKSRRVVPRRLLEAGYVLQFAQAEAAFKNLA